MILLDMNQLMMANLFINSKHSEISEDLIHIPEGLQQLDFTQYIFELISIEIPWRKVHPKFEQDEEDEDSEDSLFYTSGEEETEESEPTQNENEIDPRWKDLINLKTTNKK